MIADLDLAKKILVQDFHLFPTRRFHPDYFVEPSMDNRLDYQGDADLWRRVRQIVSPTFSTSRMKTAYKLIDGCCNTMKEYLNGAITSKKQTVFTIQSLYGSYTMDVVAR